MKTMSLTLAAILAISVVGPAFAVPVPAIHAETRNNTGTTQAVNKPDFNARSNIRQVQCLYDPDLEMFICD